MEYVWIAIIAFMASMMTFFSGFGLGTILLPVFALFFPVEAAVAMTSIVHLANNLFKLLLVGKAAQWSVVLRFGLPAVVLAAIGAMLLIRISDVETLFTYRLRSSEFKVSAVNLVIGLLLMVFALMEIIPVLRGIAFSRRFLELGGALSGFFGGLSGHQGALRTAFLINLGLDKTAFIGTAVIISCIIDISRLTVYSSSLFTDTLISNYSLLTVAILAAMSGAFIGNRLLKKITMSSIQKFVAILLFIMAFGIAMGII